MNGVKMVAKIQCRILYGHNNRKQTYHLNTEGARKEIRASEEESLVYYSKKNWNQWL